MIFEVGAAVEGEKSSTQVPGKHLWDICEYDKIRVIKIYQASCLIVALAYMKISEIDIDIIVSVPFAPLRLLLYPRVPLSAHSYVSFQPDYRLAHYSGPLSVHQDTYSSIMTRRYYLRI
jgi:hypothetical protein